jgi:hypothetical protein
VSSRPGPRSIRSPIWLRFDAAAWRKRLASIPLSVHHLHLPIRRVNCQFGCPEVWQKCHARIPSAPTSSVCACRAWLFPSAKRIGKAALTPRQRPGDQIGLVLAAIALSLAGEPRRRGQTCTFRQGRSTSPGKRRSQRCAARIAHDLRQVREGCEAVLANRLPQLTQKRKCHSGGHPTRMPEPSQPPQFPQNLRRRLRIWKENTGRTAPRLATTTVPVRSFPGS